MFFLSTVTEGPTIIEQNDDSGSERASRIVIKLEDILLVLQSKEADGLHRSWLICLPIDLLK